MGTDEHIQVVVADPLFGNRLLLELALEGEADIELVGQAQSGTAAAELCERLHPDVLVVDLHLPRINGVDLVPLVKTLSPDTMVILWSGSDDQRAQHAARQHGADAQIAKHVGADELVAAIRRVCARARRAELLTVSL